MALTALAHIPVPPPDMLYERVGGKFVEKKVSAHAVWLAGRLMVILDAAARLQRLGQAVTEMVFVLDPERDFRRRPDVAFVSSARWPLERQLPWKSDWPIAPDLAVEIVSPGNSMSEMMRKRRDYFRYGVREVWIVLPEERQVHCYTDDKTVRILDATDTLTTPILPDWSLPIADWLPLLPEDEDQPAEAKNG